MPAALRTFTALAALLWVQAVHALTLEGIDVPEAVSVGGRTLVLNGTAVRRMAIYKFEVAALYLPVRQSTTEAVLGEPGPKRLRLNMLRDVRSDDMAKRFMSDFRAASAPGEWNSLVNEMIALGGMLSNAIKAGDLLTVDWLPGEGMVIAKNGVALADKPIANELMFRIILRIFLGPQAQEQTRLQLLGLRPPQP